MKEQLIKGALLPTIMRKYPLDEWELPISTFEDSRMDNALFSFAETFDLEEEVASVLEKGYVTIKGTLPESGYQSKGNHANIIGILVDNYMVHKLGHVLMESIVVPELLPFTTFDYEDEGNTEERLTVQGCNIPFKYSGDLSGNPTCFSYKLGLKEDAISVLKKGRLVEKQIDLLRTSGAIGKHIYIPLSLGEAKGKQLVTHLAIHIGDFATSVVKLTQKRV